MKTYTFKVIVERDENLDGSPMGWHAYCPALEREGASTWGATQDEALSHINELVHLIVEEHLEEGRPLPDGPSNDVEVADVSHEEPRIAITV